MSDSAYPGEPAAYPGSEHDADWRRLVMPADYRQPEPRERYHLVVIGAGPAGLVASIAAAGLGAKVALIEKRAMGGDCLNVGCVPSKALLEFTRGGIDAERFDDAFEWLRGVRASIAGHDSVQRYTEAGVDVFLGSARFLDQDAVQVGNLRLQTRRTLIATGSRPVLPPVPGLAESRPHTNETLFDLRRRPRRLAVIGGGPIGCELGQAFANIGTDVVMLEAAERVLPAESAEAADAVAAALGDAGVRLRLGARIASVARRGTTVAIADESGGEESVDEVLVAAGRRANTDELNLAAVGVELDASGRVVVDRRLRTTNPRIYAAGDVCSAMQLTHNADAHARIVVQNALFAPTASADRLVIPRCVYTSPELAQVGPHRDELERDGTAFDAYRVRFGALDRGRMQDDRNGYAEVLTAAGTDRIIGATLVGRDAGEQIAAITTAMTLGFGLADLGKVIQPYPTRAEFIRRIADEYNRKRLTPTARRVLQGWLRWRA